MNRPADSSRRDEIARVAYAIWEAEGRPDGRDHEHWMQATRVVDEGRAELEYPPAGEPDEAGARPVQPGFRDVPPGIVPRMKEDAGPELREDPGGRFATQLSEAPEERGDGAAPAGEGARAAKAGKRGAAKRAGDGKDDSYVRPAGRKEMDLPPSRWTKTDEEIDESFPASDPPGNY